MTDQTGSPLTPSEIAQLANAKAQGKRPQYFADPMDEHSFSMNMALMAELAVARERIDTLERILVKKGVLHQDDVESFVPDSLAGEERQRAQVEFSARMFRPLQQQVEAMRDKKSLSMHEMAQKLAETDEPEREG